MQFGFPKGPEKFYFWAAVHYHFHPRLLGKSRGVIIADTDLSLKHFGLVRQLLRGRFPINPRGGETLPPYPQGGQSHPVMGKLLIRGLLANRGAG